jgi:uncharacterized CHY-type Zn-finger protein
MVETEKIICGVCKKEITEDYPMVYNSQFMHGTCYNKIIKRKK